MSNPFDDGGPAVPFYDGQGGVPGMTLRDYFAGQALAGILAASGDNAGFVEYHDDVVAVNAWRIASEMITKRGGNR